MSPEARTVSARAHANIALVKYWGKRDAALNLPAAGSMSLTLAALTTTATVTASQGGRDELELDGHAVVGPTLARFSAWADLVRAAAGGPELRFQVTSANDFPTASGLASSASAYAALALGVSRAAGLSLSPEELSVLARRGSGSAARSIFGGLVVMRPGTRSDGSDSHAEQLMSADELASSWPLAMVIAVVGGGRVKGISSRAAMDHCAETSPLYAGWLASVPGDLAAARAAIEQRDLHALGEVAEQSALTMHAAALAARPAIAYFRPATIALIEAVQELRRAGTTAFFTMDAGPHVKILTTPSEAAAVARRVSQVADVSKVIESGPGGGAEVV
ncbi:MAG TPA: diphosphomevalonate decarboxylase [Kofleriaceae bacterium]|nr:diphosphomevalonate decarboxylase [Kofleriaceae bacterium]